MRLIRRLAYPVRLAGVRLRHRAAAALLLAAGVAAGTAMLSAVLAGSLLAQDRRVGIGLRDVPLSERVVRASWFGLPREEAERQSALDARVRRALARVTGAEPASLVLFRESTIAGRFLGLGAVDGLSSWISLRSGRPPRRCRPERCEVVRLRGEGPLPSTDGLRLVEVGRATLRSPVLFGDFIAPAERGRTRAALSPRLEDAAAYHRPPPAPLVLAEGVAPLTESPELVSAYRSYSWVVPLEDASIRSWEIEQFSADLARARSTLAARSAVELTAPVDELREAGESARVGGRRLLLVGGQAAALLFAFAVLAAVALRRDVEAARRRLTWYGARRWQPAALVMAETATAVVAGTGVGWALGTGAAALVASRAGAPAGEVLAHSSLAPDGLLTAAAAAVALSLVLAVTLLARPRRVRGLSFTALDAAALGAAAVVGATLARGDLDEASLAGGSGSAASLVLLPGLVTFVAAVVFVRLFRPALLGLERLARGRSVALRLAALSVARRPGRAAATGAFLVVSLGLALFAESYRATLARGQAAQAAWEVPLDFTLRQDVFRLVPVREAAPPERLSALGEGVRVEQVLRVSGNVSGAGPRTGVTVLGVDPEILPSLEGWRPDFARASSAEIVRRLAAPEQAALSGPVLPAEARRLVLPARGRSVGLVASVETPAGDFVHLPLGETAPRPERPLAATVPDDARGGRIVALTLVPPRIEERGAEAGRPYEGELVLGRPAVETSAGVRRALGGFSGWVGTGGVETNARADTARLAFALSEQVTSRFRPRQASDGRPIPALASPAVAAVAGEDGRLPLRVGGEPVDVRVVAVARAFPGARGDFLVAHRELLRTALNTQRPGIAVVDELWLDVADEGRAAHVAARLARPPFDALAVSSRAEVERSLRDDPLARSVLLTLLAGAGVALVLALLGVLLGVLSDVRDERSELRDLEAQGARPATLRRVVRLRAAVVAVAGLAGGLAAAGALSLLVVELVAVTAEARAAELPLLLAVEWRVLLPAAACVAAAASALVLLASRRV
ncbi:MAG TPA: hypothetical protein VHF23_00250 [Gaiellaceae bacterium]|nr:hypothetical protein [Gaiellaceae bacterium]